MEIYEDIDELQKDFRVEKTHFKENKEILMMNIGSHNTWNLKKKVTKTLKKLKIKIFKKLKTLIDRN